MQFALLHERAERLFGPSPTDMLFEAVQAIIGAKRAKRDRAHRRKAEMTERLAVVAEEKAFAREKLVTASASWPIEYFQLGYALGLRNYKPQPTDEWQAERRQEQMRAKDPRFQRALGTRLSDSRCKKPRIKHVRTLREQQEAENFKKSNANKRKENPYVMTASGRIFLKEDLEFLNQDDEMYESESDGGDFLNTVHSLQSNANKWMNKTGDEYNAADKKERLKDTQDWMGNVMGRESDSDSDSTSSYSSDGIG